jgi:hypothetical protein
MYLGWSTYNKCIPSQTAKDTCLALSDNQCLSQGSGCTLRGDCNAKVTATRTGFGGAHCDIPQDAILGSSAGDQKILPKVLFGVITRDTLQVKLAVRRACASQDLQETTAKIELERTS